MINSAKDILNFTNELNIKPDYDIYFFLSHVDYYLLNNSSDFNASLNTRVSYKEPYYYNFDGRRDISLCVIYFDDVAVAITQNAGREGDDHEELFVLNRDLFIDCVNYIDELCEIDKSDYDRFASLNVIDESYDKEDLTCFYGYNVNVFNYNDLSELSDYESVKCQIGDVLEAEVLKDQGPFGTYSDKYETREVIVESKSDNNLYRYIYGYLKTGKKRYVPESRSPVPDFVVDSVEDASLLNKEERVYVLLNYKLKQIIY